MASLKEYRRKRRFDKTPEPSGPGAASRGSGFVVQKHAARRLHFDFRLEINGVLKSWAVPKGPSLNPADKRLAVETEDHPLDYGDFEGVIPERQYGAGTVMVWDRGTFTAVGGATASAQLARGELKFTLEGQKLRGGFVLVKLRRSTKGNEWLLIKHRDSAAERSWNIEHHDGSVLTGRTLSEIAEGLPAAHTVVGPNPEEFPDARKATMPSRLLPMQATLVEKPFSDRDWLFEIKWDGVRALTWVRNGKIELRSRTGQNITLQYPELSTLPERLRAKRAILDGEIVVLDQHGQGDFEQLQARMNVSCPSSQLQREAPVTYYLFDILYCDGYDLRHVPLEDRRRFLQRLLEARDPFRYSDHQKEKGKELFALAQEQQLEGIVGKHIRSPYVTRRSPYWVKFKVIQEVDAVVAGWTAPRGSREHFGALLLGLYQGNKLRFVGGVGSGFTQKTQKEIFQSLKELARTRCLFETAPKTKEKAYWAQPVLVVRAKHGGWTKEGRLRQPVFLGLHRDRKPSECRFESASPASARPRVVAAPAVVGHVLTRKTLIEKELFKGRAEDVSVEIDGKLLRMSNLNKVYFPQAGYTKRHLLAYYYRVARYLLPFLQDRPLVLRRYPEGIKGQSFFQKEAGEGVPDWMETVGVYSEERKTEIRYFVANHCAALLYLTNLGCIDHNPWSSRSDDLDHPDYVFFDLDPTEGTKFATVVAVGQAVCKRLRSLKLEAFVKTSGATGLHIYVPLRSGYTYAQARTFAEIVARVTAAEETKKVTLERAVEKRPRGTVLIDTHQNAFGRPLAAPYTVRPFPSAPVSAPLTPGELKRDLLPERFTMKNIFRRLDKRGDLWADFRDKSQGLEEATSLLTRQLSKARN